MTPTARRLLGATATTAVLLPSVALLAASPAQAGRDDNRFQLKADGSSQLYEISQPSIPGAPSNSASSLAAYSLLTSNGESYSFAAAPYYGTTVTTSPSLVNGLLPGLTGQNINIPVESLPGLVEARYPSSTTASNDTGVARVRADSSQYSSSAAGDNGGPPGASAKQQQTATSLASITPEGAAVAKAVGRTAGVGVAGLQDIDAGAEALITDAGNAPKITSSSGGTFVFAGQKFAFDEKGFSVPGQPAAKADAMLADLNKQLAAARTKIETNLVTRKVDRDGSITLTTAALRVTTIQNVPASGVGQFIPPEAEVPGLGGVPEPQGDATIVYTFGFVRVSSVNVPFGSDGEGSSSSGSGSGSSGSSSSSGGAGSGGGAPGTSTGGGSSSGGATGGGELDTSDLAPSAPDSVADAPPGVGQGSDGPAVLGFAPQAVAQSGSTELLYLVLVLGGFAIFAGQHLMGRFGIKLALTTA